MERLRAGRVTIRGSEIDCDGKADLATSKNVVEESVALLDVKLGEGHLVVAAERPLLLICDRVLTLSFLEHGEGDGNLADVAMLTRLGGLIEVELDFAFNIIA